MPRHMRLRSAACEQRIGSGTPGQMCRSAGGKVKALFSTKASASTAPRVVQSLGAVYAFAATGQPFTAIAGHGLHTKLGGRPLAVV